MTLYPVASPSRCGKNDAILNTDDITNLTLFGAAVALSYKPLVIEPALKPDSATVKRIFNTLKVGGSAASLVFAFEAALVITASVSVLTALGVVATLSVAIVIFINACIGAVESLTSATGEVSPGTAAADEVLEMMSDPMIALLGRLEKMVAGTSDGKETIQNSADFKEALEKMKSSDPAIAAFGKVKAVDALWKIKQKNEELRHKVDRVDAQAKEAFAKGRGREPTVHEAMGPGRRAA